MNIGTKRTYADGDYVVVSSSTSGWSTTLTIEPDPHSPRPGGKGFTVNVHLGG